MQFQIPQFIEAEDKIVGPLTLKQFLYVGGAIGLSMMLYFLVSFIIWLPIAVILVVGGFALAFIKINGRPLTVLSVSAFGFFWKPRLYVWQPEKTDVVGGDNSSSEGEGFSVARIAEGLALSHVWQKVQTGSASSNEKAKLSVARLKERYQVLNKITGERQAARRIDYR
jgi:PrgI family protein